MRLSSSWPEIFSRPRDLTLTLARSSYRSTSANPVLVQVLQAFVAENPVILFEHGFSDVRPNLVGNNESNDLGIGPGGRDDGRDYYAGIQNGPDHLTGCLLFFFRSPLAAATARLISLMGILSRPLALASCRTSSTALASSARICLRLFFGSATALRLIVSWGVIRNWLSRTSRSA